MHMARVRRTDDPQFNRFWNSYPKHVAKLDAQKAWAALNLKPEDVDAILVALEWQRRQPSWQKDGGAFIPYPATYLRAGRWMDEPTVAVAPVTAPPKLTFRANWYRECFEQHGNECQTWQEHETKMGRDK